MYQKTYDFLIYVYPFIAQYPKYEKFTLQTATKNAIIEFAMCIVRANKSTAKKSKLYEADILLEQIRMLFRLANDLRYLPPKRYENVSKKLSEIGALLGGMIRKEQSK